MIKTLLSVILMVHNEEETIKEEVKSYYREIVKKIPGSEMIVVDDGNTDKTSEILHTLKNKYSLKLLVPSQKIGYAKSLRWSLEKAQGELVFYADAGGKHDSRDFWKLYRYRDKYDLITGYKKTRHDPWYRLFLAWGLNTVVNLYFGVRFSDIDCGYKLFNRTAVKALLAESWVLQDNISLELVLRAVYGGLKTTEIPVKHFARQFGPSRGLPLKKIPIVAAKLLLTFPRLKKEIMILEKGRTRQEMNEGYNKLFPTGKYREIWEGKISLVYKLPKYLKLIKRYLTQITKKQSVLEIGCGDGEIGESLLKDVNLPIVSYTATEWTKGGVNIARKKLQKFKSAKVLQADVNGLSFKDKSFDTVFSFDVMHHVADPNKMAKEIVRVVKHRIFLIESNGLSLARRLAEQQIRYKKMGEKSYFPWEYSQFFSLPRVKKFRMRPFLFMFPHCPNVLIPANILFSEILEKIPVLNWQCSGVIIEVSLNRS